jgi:hypothetical protein
MAGTRPDLEVQHQPALALSAHLLRDGTDQTDQPLRFDADPSGHPSWIFVGR